MAKNKTDETTEQQNTLDTLKDLQSLIDANKAIIGGRKDDLRLEWDIKLIKGQDKLYYHKSGTSSLPSMLSYGMIAEGPYTIHNEVRDKIMAPLVSFMQDILDATPPQYMPSRKSNGDHISEEECFQEEGCVTSRTTTP